MHDDDQQDGIHTAEQVHDILRRAHREIAALRGRLPPVLSANTGLAIGDALGYLAKAARLVERDLNAAASASPADAKHAGSSPQGTP
jgi:hypothetical protein